MITKTEKVFKHLLLLEKYVLKFVIGIKIICLTFFKFGEDIQYVI